MEAMVSEVVATCMDDVVDAMELGQCVEAIALDAVAARAAVSKGMARVAVADSKSLDQNLMEFLR